MTAEEAKRNQDQLVADAEGEVMDKQEINFDMNEVLNDSFRKDQKDATKGLFCMYQDFIEAGFTEDQAMDLLKLFMTMNVKRVQ